MIFLTNTSDLGGGVVKNKSDEILFIYRMKKWDLPKGKLDKGETIKDCAKREVEEETMVDVECKEKITSTWHTYTRNKKYVLKKTTWFRMDSVDAVSYTHLTLPTNREV